MRTSVDLHEKLAKQNDISRRRLSQQLEKLDKVEKSDLRMIETERQRFRSRHKKLESPQKLATSNPVNVRMYDTHNPGFCYHCTGAIKESGPSSSESPDRDSYEVVRSMLFTNGEVDHEKVLTLHLLAAHTTRWNGVDDANVKPVKSLLDQGRKKSFTSAWNNILPCYIIDSRDSSSEASDNIKLHEDPLKINLEDEAIRYFERRYKRYIEENGDFGKTLPMPGSVNKGSRPAPTGILRRQMPIISPHVYSLLGASHEMRLKRAMLDGRRKFPSSRYDPDIFEEENLSLKLDDNDGLSSGVTGGLSSKNWTKSFFNHSRRIPHRSVNLDHRITMLRMGYDRSLEHSLIGSKNSIGQKDLLTIKSSCRAIKATISRSSSLKSPFCNMSENISISNSCTSNAFITGSDIRRYRKRIYLNSPIKNVELRNKIRRTVPILVNYQVEALVHSILEVLEQVSSDKLTKIVTLARDPEELTKLLIRPEIQTFIQSLLGQSLISSPQSYVVSSATIAEEIDLKYEGLLEKEVVALTLEVPDLPGLTALVTDIRNNIFTDGNKEERTPLCPSPRNLKESQVHSILYESKSQDVITPKDETLSHPSPHNTYKRNSIDAVQNGLNADQVLSSIKNSFLERAYEISKNNIGKGSTEKRPSMSKEINRDSSTSNSKFRLSSKARRSWQDSNHSDVDSTILRRMTNNQRILIGQMCASLKAKRINREGLIDERMPLAALIAPAFSHDSIKALTRGTIYSKEKVEKKPDEESHRQGRDEEKQENLPADKLTGPVLAKIRQDVAVEETKQRLQSFLQTPVE